VSFGQLPALFETCNPLVRAPGDGPLHESMQYRCQQEVLATWMEGGDGLCHDAKSDLVAVEPGPCSDHVMIDGGVECSAIGWQSPGARPK
jgi:hypothetical protein